MGDIGCPTSCKVIILGDKIVPLLIFSILTPLPPVLGHRVALVSGAWAGRWVGGVGSKLGWPAAATVHRFGPLSRSTFCFYMDLLAND